MLSGDLAVFSLGEIFQSLAINNHSGTLKIECPNQGTKQVYLNQGSIAYFTDGSPSQRVGRFGENFVRTGVITSSQLEEALVEQRGTKELLGEVLLRKQFVTEEDLLQALTAKTLEGVLDLFLLTEGTFEFHMNQVPPELEDGIQKRIPVTLDTSSVIIEGLRQGDEWSVIRKKIVTFNEIFTHRNIPGDDPHDISALLLDLVTGSRPVRDLFQDFPGSRFECCKLLCELLEKGSIQALTAKQCKTLALDKLEKRQYPQAANFLQYAAQLEPTNAETHSMLGEALGGAYLATAAKTAYTEAIRLYFEQEKYQPIADLGDTVMGKFSLGTADLERFFYSFVRLQNFRKASSAGSQLVSLLQKQGEFAKAAGILEAMAALDPDDLNLKIQVAEFFEKAGDSARATCQLEEVATILERDKKLRELIKILRLLSSINPTRQDLKQRIAAVKVLQETLTKRRKVSITIAGISCISIVVLAIIPLLYEVKAREYYDHAERLENTSAASMDFRFAKEAYLEVVQNYAFSTRAAYAHEALERISDRELGLFTKIQREEQARRKEYNSKLSALKTALAAGLRDAGKAEEEGNLQRAHDIYKRVAVDYAEIPATRNILVPLQINSDPSGATVVVDGKVVGKTPVLYRYVMETTFELLMTKASCETIQQTIKANGQWELHFSLRRRALGEYTPVLSVQQPMVLCDDRVILPSRDGMLYAINPMEKAVLWERRVGRFGDRYSDLCVSDTEIYLGTVTGEVTAISNSTGKSRWIRKVRGSIFAAPACSPDRKWIAVGTTAGTVHLLSQTDGSPAGGFSTDNEILARPVFWKDLLIVGSTDNHLYGYSLKEGKVKFREDMGSDIVLDPVLAGDDLLGSGADGNVWCLDLKTSTKKWSSPLRRTPSTPVVVSPSGVHVGSSAGHVVTLDRQTGEVLWDVAAGKGMVVGLIHHGTVLLTALNTGKVAAANIDKHMMAWEYQADMPLLTSPLLSDGVLYIGGAGGKIKFLGVLE
jgi:outer membrane protein assembly factor BamB/tetratricopeptide (TPR) repeat protein